MVTKNVSPIMPTGVGKKDYSLNISSSTVPIRAKRESGAGVYAFVGATSCNVNILFPIYHEGVPETPESPTIIWYDFWVAINSTKTIKANLHEYLTWEAALAADALGRPSPYRVLGGGYGTGKVQFKWSTGVKLVPTRCYLYNLYVDDITLTNFIAWIGMAGIVDEPPGR